MPTSLHRLWRPIILRILLVVIACATPFDLACAEGEPAQDFLKRLRAAKYFDTAITYLDRLDQYPGVDASFKSAIALEKAQTYIDAALATQSSKTLDRFFVQAEQQLALFLKQDSHPRFSEARLQLGKLQMVRAAQLMNGTPDDAKRESARESYLAAAKTFDAIVEDLRGKITEMRGAKIDPDKEPEKVALRNQYRGEFLKAKYSAGETRRLAAGTYRDPGKEGKQLLQTALEEFTELSEKFARYVEGSKAMLSRGQVQHELGMDTEALDSYIRMLEQSDDDRLRDSKAQATSGMIRLWLDQAPPKYQQAIERGERIVDDVRPNERRTASLQELRVGLAKAYLLKSKDSENLKAVERKRAESSGRQLLIAASKVPGEFMDEAKELLAGMGIQDEVADLPKAEDPDDLSDALEKARILLSASENISQSLDVLVGQKDPSKQIQNQIVELKKNLLETRSIAIQILRRGLSMVGSDTDHQLLSQARQFLAYLLYEQKHYRAAAVVGTFLARNSPGTEIGLVGGVVALNSFQLLLAEIPENENEGMIAQLQQLGDYLTKTWPDDPKASAAQGVMIRIALSKDRWEDARSMVKKMPDGVEKASFQRLMGQLLWNQSILARQAGKDSEVAKLLAEAQSLLQLGLTGIPTDIVDPQAMRAALILVKVHLKLGDVSKAAKVLDHPKYGPTTLLAKQGPPDAAFPSDLYGTELQVVVQQMTASDGDQQALLKRASSVMDKLRQSVTGPDAQKRLTGIYLRMARDIREQLESASADKKTKLIEAFRIFLDRVAGTTNDKATLQWVGQTLIELGESSMPDLDKKATGQSADLLTTAVKTFEELKQQGGDLPLTVRYQLGRAQRLLGNYGSAIKSLDSVLTEKPMMLDAQVEAAKAYEQWAAILPPKVAGQAYGSALNGPKKRKVIWGWGKISQLTSRDPKYQAMFFDARYHLASCRYRWGKAVNSDPLMEKAITDITKVNALYSKMGGAAQRTKFDRLLKRIQKDLGKEATGLPPTKNPAPAKKAAPAKK